MTLFSVKPLAAAASLAAVALIGLQSSTLAASSQPFLHPLFCDNMVLQRGASDPVWGWAAPGQTVTVSIDGKTAKAVAGPDGKWMARVGPFAAGGPYTLTVSGPQTVTLNNVMVGDIWICSGQSNMQFGIGNADNAAAETANANYPNIRLFMVSNVASPTPNTTVPVNGAEGHWQPCSPQTIAMGGWNGFTAVGYFFGRDLQQDIHVPIGLIETTWGGTIAEAWTSAEALDTMPDFQPAVANLQKQTEGSAETYQDKLKAWYANHDPGSVGATWGDPALDVSSWKTMSLPQLFQDAGDPSVANVNGVIWFRRTFDLPAGDAGKDAVLHLMVDDNDTTWVNGVLVGATDGYNVQRAYNIAAGLLKPTGNTIAVRVLDTGGKGGIWGDGTGLRLDVTSGATLSLAGPWSYKLGTTLPTDNSLPTPSSNPNVVTVLYNGMIAPLIPFGIKGVLWYQGESNVGRGKQYQTLLPTMIQDWRSRFGSGQFPFLIVQLANLGQTPTVPGESGWAELREAQLLTSERLPKTGLALAVDIGNPTDIHPKNKQEVGRRLALNAEAIAYGQKVEYSGPIYRSMTVEGAAIRLHFTHVTGGLVCKNADKLTGFEIAGADGKFVWADAKIDGNSLVVSSSTVPAPTAVRYAWADNPSVTLYNGDGLPASPFQTDGPEGQK
jgi:sialate O-acetylesterase